MEVKTFRAENVQAALALVRQELGPHASVLGTREIRSGLFSWQSRTRLIEVTASAHAAVPSRLPLLPRPTQVSSKMAMQAAMGLDLSSHAEATGATQRTARPGQSGTGQDADGARKDSVGRPRQSADRATARHREAKFGRDASSEAPWLAALRQHLARAELRPDLTEALIERAVARGAVDSASALSLLVEALSARLKVARPLAVDSDERNVVALVGPTGVGKTTTLAKLAAAELLEQGRRVGIITLDDGHSGAAQQLRSCAALLDLPIEHAASTDELNAALDRMAGQKLVLIDTPGAGTADDEQFDHLRTLLGEAAPHAICLVASCVSGGRNLEHIARVFAPLGPTSLVLTKSDEAAAHGSLLSLVEASNLPVSYVTNGPKVPDDIMPAQPLLLARMILDF